MLLLRLRATCLSWRQDHTDPKHKVTRLLSGDFLCALSSNHASRYNVAQNDLAYRDIRVFLEELMLPKAYLSVLVGTLYRPVVIALPLRIEFGGH